MDQETMASEFYLHSMPIIVEDFWVDYVFLLEYYKVYCRYSPVRYELL